MNRFFLIAVIGFLLSGIGVLGSNSGFTYEIKYAHEAGLKPSEVLNANFLPKPSVKSQSGTNWLQLHVKSHTNNQLDLVAQLPVNDILACTVYRKMQNKLHKTEITGNKAQITDKKFSKGYPAFSIGLAAQANDTFYLEINKYQSPNCPVQIVDETEYYDAKIEHQVFNAGYYGILFIVIVVNLLFYLKFKEPLYLIYLQFLISYNVGNLFFDGMFIGLLRNVPFSEYFEPIAHVLTAGALTLFSSTLLNLDMHYPHLKRAAWAMLIPMIVLYVLSFLLHQYLFYMLAELIGLIVFLMFWISSFLLIKKIAYAKFYAAGYALFLSTCFLYFVLDIGFVRLAIVKIGGIIDMLVFTYAIVSNMKRVREDNIKMKLEIESLISKQLASTNKVEADPLFALLTKNQFSEQPLTVRELDILRYINEDLTNQQMADKLFVSVNTVKYHVKNLYEKLEVKNKMEAKEKFVSISKND